MCEYKITIVVTFILSLYKSRFEITDAMMGSAGNTFGWNHNNDVDDE